MDFRELETYLKVAERGSFSGAARELFVSQPTVTARVQALEAELGAPLLRREGKGCRPTAAGEVLERYARQLLNLRQDCLDELHALRRTASAPFRIGATALGAYILPELAKRWEEQYPDKKLFFSVSNTGKVLEELRRGELDAALAPLPEGDVRGQFVLWPVGQDALMLVCGADNPLARKSRLRPEDLRGQRFLMREKGSRTREIFETWLRDQGLEGSDAAELGQSETIRRAVAQNVGISLLSTLSLQPGDSSVCPLKMEGFPILREYSVITLPGKDQPAQAENFARLVRELW